MEKKKSRKEKRVNTGSADERDSKGLQGDASKQEGCPFSYLFIFKNQCGRTSLSSFDGAS